MRMATPPAPAGAIFPGNRSRPDRRISVGIPREQARDSTGHRPRHAGIGMDDNGLLCRDAPEPGPRPAVNGRRAVRLLGNVAGARAPRGVPLSVTPTVTVVPSFRRSVDPRRDQRTDPLRGVIEPAGRTDSRRVVDGLDPYLRLGGLLRGRTASPSAAAGRREGQHRCAGPRRQAPEYRPVTSPAGEVVWGPQLSGP